MRVAVRVTVGLLVISACVGVSPTGANADGLDHATTDVTATRTSEGNTHVRASQQLGEAGAPVRSSGGTISCTYIDVGEELDPHGYGGVNGQLAGFVPASELVEGWWYYVACSYDGMPGEGRFFQYEPGQLPIDTGALAAEAAATLTIAYPTPHTSPARHQRQLVGLPTWLWIDTDGFDAASATASIPGLSVTATATPTSITWDLGDGTDPVTCTDAGTPYDPNRPDDAQTTDCSHTYQHHGTHTATVTTTWTTTWSATNGESGTLPGTTRTTSFELDVIQRQAVIVDGP